MSYRYTNTDKWSDAWFSNLKQIEMLLFVYLCDNCDIAGFIEVNYKRWASDLNSSIETIEGALKGLQRGLIISNDMDCVFIKNFLKHQKNMPLNQNNKAHLGILRRFENYRYKFDIQDINQFIEGASKGLQSPTGIGNGIGNGNEKKAAKIEKKFIAPTVEQVIEYFKSNGYPDELAIRFFKGYSEADWIDSHGNKVINWKQKAQMVWFKESNKYQQTQTQNNSPPQSTNKAQQVLDNNKAVLANFLKKVENGEFGNSQMSGEGDAGRLLGS